MRKAWLVTRKELRMMARTRVYLVVTAVGPLAIVALLAVSVLVERLIYSSVQGRTLAFVAAGPMLEPIRTELAAYGITVEQATEEPELLAKRVRAGGLNGYVVFPADVLGPEEPRYVTGDSVFLPRSTLISDVVARAVVRRRLELEGVDPTRVTMLTRLPRVQLRVLDKTSEVDPDREGSLALVMAFIGLLLVMLSVYGHAVGEAVLTEKTGKTAEIMLSSLPPFALLMGKVLGKGLAGVLQASTWMVISTVMIEALRSQLGVPLPPFVPPGSLLALIGFFALGFFLYSTAYAIAGAVATDHDNFSQLVWPVNVIELGLLALALFLTVNPDGPLAVTLSLIPVTAPMVMFMRVVVGQPGVGQVVVAVAGTALLTAAAVWAAARVFRLGILLTGKQAALREIVRLLRA